MAVPRLIRKVGIGVSAGVLTGLLVTGGIALADAGAQVVDPLEDLIASLDAAWILVAAFLVFFMQGGFALLTAGFVRAKNTSNILMKNILDASLGAIVYWMFGFGIAFGTTADFMGLDKFFITPSAEGGATGGTAFGDTGVPLFAFWIFQWAFAATAATIVAGALAERTKFRGYLIYSVFITGFIYPVVSHWVWGGGWLYELGVSDNGFLDFAGSSVVHSVGAWAGLMGALIVGPRIGKYLPDGTTRAIVGHSMPLAVAGMFILWFGWYGFNPGSTLGLSGGGAALAAQVAVNTTLAAGAGGAAAVLLSMYHYKVADTGLVVNGILGGLVAVTAGCGFVDPYAALIIGAIGGSIIIYSVRFFDWLHIDDPVGVISVHGACGVWGTLAVGLFATKSLVGGGDDYGLLLGGGIEQLGAQVIGIVAIFGWVTVTAGILFLAIKHTVGLRVSEAEELAGIDVTEHGIGAYPEFPTVIPGAAVETSASTSQPPSGGGD